MEMVVQEQQNRRVREKVTNNTTAIQTEVERAKAAEQTLCK